MIDSWDNDGKSLSSGLFVRVDGSNQYTVKSLRSRGMEALPHGLRLFVFNIHLYSFVCIENEYALCKPQLCVTISNPHETVKFSLVLRPCFMQRNERSSEKRGQTGFNMLKGRQAQKRPPSWTYPWPHGLRGSQDGCWNYWTLFLHLLFVQFGFVIPRLSFADLKKLFNFKYVNSVCPPSNRTVSFHSINSIRIRHRIDCIFC